jgi:hypothetical protein
MVMMPIKALHWPPEVSVTRLADAACLPVTGARELKGDE